MNTNPSNQPSAIGTGADPDLSLTPGEARAALEQAANRQVGGDRDRRIYGQALALSGLVIGAFVAIRQGLTPGAFAWLSSGTVAALFVLTIVGIEAWQRHSSRSIPRGAKRAGYVGLGFTLVVMVLVIGALNWRGQEAPNPAWELLLGAVAVAAPLGVTGLAIGRGRS